LDAFVIAFTNDFSSAIYSAYLGGSVDDFGYAIAVDPVGNAYIAGQTLSTDFPTNNALHAALNGSSDAFLAKIISNPDPPLLSLSARGGRGQVAWNAGFPFEPDVVRLFKLETSTNIYSTNWTPMPQSPILSNNWYSVVFNPTNRAAFFRLREVQP